MLGGKHPYEYLCHLVVGIFWLSFLIQVDVFLDFDMSDFFRFKPGHFRYYVMRRRILFKSSVLIILLLTLLWYGKGNTISLLPGGMKVETPQSAFTDTCGKGLLITAWKGGGSGSL